MTDEKTGFHKGAIQTLLGEKAELIKMLGAVDQLILAHNNALKEQGIDFLEELKKLQEEQQKKQGQQPSPQQQEPVQAPEPKEETDDFDYEEPERLP